MGYPSINHRNYLRSSVIFKQLPDMAKDIQALQKEIQELKAKLEEK